MYSVINFNKIKYLYTYSYLIFNTKICVYKSLQGSLIKKFSIKSIFKNLNSSTSLSKKKRKKSPIALLLFVVAADGSVVITDPFLSIIIIFPGTD